MGVHLNSKQATFTAEFREVVWFFFNKQAKNKLHTCHCENLKSHKQKIKKEKI
jgi:hypothetical protein